MTSPGRTATRSVTVALVGLAAAWALHWYGNRHHFDDLRIYWGAVRWWSAGHPLYTFSVPDPVQGSLGYTYPPFAAVLMYPMAWISLFGTIVIMWIASAVSVVITTWWLLAPVADRHGWPRWYAVGLAIPLVCVLEPVRETVTFGQINLVLAVLVVGDLVILTPRGSRWAGVGVGLAAAIKLTPAIFIGYLLVTRRYRAAITATATAAVATLLAVAFGPRDSWRYWTDVLWQGSRVGHLDGIPNQSLLGGLSRLAFPHPANRLLWLVLVLVVLVFGLWRARRAGLADQPVAGLALAGIVGALVSPVSWQHHLYWFIPALVVLLDTAATRGAERRVWYAVLGAGVWLTVTFSVIAWFDWRIVPRRITHTPLGLLIGDWHLLLMLLLLAVLPVAATPPSGRAGSPAEAGAPAGEVSGAEAPGAAARPDPAATRTRT